MKTILVPTDFSDYAKNALDFAYGIAKKSGASVKLINVIEAPAGSTFSTMGEVSGPNEADQMYVMKLIERNKEYVQEIVNDDKYEDITIYGNVLVGNPFKSIANEISEQEVDLVVMGTHGASGMEEVFIGSTTEKVVRRAHCPVISIKKYADPESINDIVFATDLRTSQPKLIYNLTTLQELIDAKLHIVTINTPSSFATDRYYRNQMKEFVKKHDIKNYTLNVYNDNVEEDGIIYFAEDIDADMIAMATHGRTGIAHLLSGSIAEDVVNHAKRPVWTFRLD